MEISTDMVLVKKFREDILSLRKRDVSALVFGRFFVLRILCFVRSFKTNGERANSWTILGTTHTELRLLTPGKKNRD